jgi:hypothetical protein
MKQFFYSSIFILALFSGSCENSVNADSGNDSAKAAMKADSLRVDSLARVKTPAADTVAETMMPADEFSKNVLGWNTFDFRNAQLESGCGCSFSLAGASFDAKQLLCMTDFDSLAVIAVHGRNILLHKIRQDRTKNTFPEDQVRETYSNGKYTLEIHTSSTGRKGDEVEGYKGVLILRADGKEVKVSVVGECGC